MANIREWLVAAEKRTGETIEAIVVGPHYSCRWSYSRRWSSEDEPLPDENILLSREDGLKKLDQEYNNGYGGANCFPMYAWTPSRVYFIGEYDGATDLNSLPRNPVVCKPNFSGEGS